MKKQMFRDWLEEKYGGKRTASSRHSNCKRIERHEGNLDDHYDNDSMESLIVRFNPRSPSHNIPIEGDVYNGTSTLRSAAKLYLKFSRNISTK
jgi:hypothetical protein